MDKLSSAHVYLRLPQVTGSFVNGLFFSGDTTLLLSFYFFKFKVSIFSIGLHILMLVTAMNLHVRIFTNFHFF